jgi:hypothetical protein
MFELKLLTREAIPAAIEKAHRYRLLNQPEQAVSICEDILQLDSEHQEALTTLILALTDCFTDARPVPPQQVRVLLSRLRGEYEREYYAGLIAEREGIAWLRSDKPRCGAAAYHCLREAMHFYEKAEVIRPVANDDAILRWNSCARIIMSHPDVAPLEEVGAMPQLGD